MPTKKVARNPPRLQKGTALQRLAAVQTMTHNTQTRIRDVAEFSEDRFNYGDHGPVVKPCVRATI